MAALITVNLWLYGPIARYAGAGEHASHANRNIRLPESATLSDLLAHIDMPTEERGFTFINGKLTATPGNQLDLDTPIKEEDRIALFHLKSMWPMQYRDGAQVSSDLERKTQ